MPRRNRSKRPTTNRARSEEVIAAAPPAPEIVHVSDPPVPPPSELEGLLDRVKATTLALLASLQDKEKTLRDRAESDPAPGVNRGLSDIAALRRWADRVLGTIEVLEKGRPGEIQHLVDELAEFGELLRKKQPAIPADPPLPVRE